MYCLSNSLNFNENNNKIWSLPFNSSTKLRSYFRDAGYKLAFNYLISIKDKIIKISLYINNQRGFYKINCDSSHSFYFGEVRR